MTNNYFNAKKVLMSTIAAVVFSFVFTTSANAGTPKEAKKSGIEIRQNPNKKGPKKQPKKTGFVYYVLHDVFGVRV